MPGNAFASVGRPTPQNKTTPRPARRSCSSIPEPPEMSNCSADKHTIPSDIASTRTALPSERAPELSVPPNSLAARVSGESSSGIPPVSPERVLACAHVTTFPSRHARDPRSGAAGSRRSLLRRRAHFPSPTYGAARCPSSTPTALHVLSTRFPSLPPRLEALLPTPIFRGCPWLARRNDTCCPARH